MPERKSFVTVCIFVFVFALVGRAQDDAPSLGDVARKSRQQKQQSDAQLRATDSKTGTIATPSTDAPSAVSTSATQNKDTQNKSVQPGVQPGAQNDKTAQAPVASGTKSAKPKHVITNDEIPSSGGPTGYRPPIPHSANTPDDGPPAAKDQKYSAGDWTSQIQAQKGAIANLQSQIQQTSDSIQYAGANCVSNCVEWNEQQKRKQDQVESMKNTLSEAQQRLEQMQDAARQQGYGSSVYDPE
jgi:hypothetical protein